MIIIASRIIRIMLRIKGPLFGGLTKNYGFYFSIYTISEFN